MRSIRIFAKNMGNPYYEPTIVVYDNTFWECLQFQIFLATLLNLENFAP